MWYVNLRASKMRFFLALVLASSLLLAAVPRATLRECWLRRTRGVKQGVWLDVEPRIDLGGLFEPELRTVLEELAGRVRREPVDARLDSVTRGLIPELHGQELDIEATLTAITAARAMSRVAPIFRPVPARVTGRDFPEHPIYAGNPARRAMALVINIAWGEDEIPRLVTVLDPLGVRATFCPVGEWLERSPAHRELLAELADAGHEVGNHGWCNRPMDEMTEDAAAEDLRMSGRLLERVTGRMPSYFTPPYGAIGPTLLRASAKMGYRTVLWSLDSIDWKQEGVPRIASRLLTRDHNGAIVLLHPTPQTAPALEVALPELLARGYRLLTLSELLSPDPRPEDIR